MISAAQWTAFFSWVKATIEAETDEVLTASQAVQADQDYPSPAAPYLTARVLTAGQPDGSTAELSSTSAGVRAIRDESATVSVQGFGADTLDWLLALIVGMDLEDLWAPLDAQGLVVEQLTPITNLSAVLDTGFEARYQMDLRIRYRRESRRIEAGALSLAQVGLTLRRFDGDPDPLTDTLDVELS